MKPGTLVRMSWKLQAEFIKNGCLEHVEEFSECVGLVEGPVEWKTQMGPEVDVRWQPSNLRYAYHPEELELA